MIVKPDDVRFTSPVGCQCFDANREVVDMVISPVEDSPVAITPTVD